MLATVVTLPAFGSVPIWDGRVYAECLLNVVYGAHPSAIACADHPTHVYLGALLPGQLISRGSSALLHLSNLALHILGLWGFGRVLGVCLRGPEHARLRALALFAAAVHPMVLGTLFHTNPDTGVYAFAFALLGTTIGAPLRERTAPAILAGLGLCFSKEPGIAVALVIAAGVMVAAPKWRTWRGAFALALPPALAVGWILWARLSGVQQPWTGSGPGARFLGFAPFAWDDPTFRAYFVGIFLLGFGWLVTGVTITDAIVGASRLVRRLPPRRSSGFDGRVATVLVAIAVVVTMGLTSYHTLHNLRYFLVLYPLWLLLGVLALVRLGVPARTRELVVGVWLGANLLGTWTSVDPVSRAFYGTFDAGQMRMYEMTSLTGECCGLGQDQLVYNLQYTGFSYAQDALFQALAPTMETVIVGPGQVSWHAFTQLESKTHMRTLRRTDVYKPVFTQTRTVLLYRQLVPEFWFIDMPNTDNDSVRTALREFYDERNAVTRTSRGVSITARQFVRR